MTRYNHFYVEIKTEDPQEDDPGISPAWITQVLTDAVAEGDLGNMHIESVETTRLGYPPERPAGL